MLNLIDPSIELTSVFIQSHRIILESIHMSYCQQIPHEFTAEITQYMFPKPPVIVEETAQFVSESLTKMEKRKELVLVIKKRENEEFLGCCGFHSRESPTTPEFGGWIKKDAHGNKYGREAIKTLKHWAIENIDFDYAIYPVDKANIASRKIAESLGGMVIKERIVKTMRESYLDEVVYKIPKTDS
ncbi:MAG: GNAT family N-acetyltransferase [Dehalococcoidia bacterium]|jgi:RimJ/RimL family protein N-acetyltransferase|nr:GNAT family N-acetyltransferase [Dehalococcoidia bacterium]